MALMKPKEDMEDNRMKRKTKFEDSKCIINVMYG